MKHDVARPHHPTSLTPLVLLVVLHAAVVPNGVDAQPVLVKAIPADVAPGDSFGVSVAISGDVAVVGSYLDDDLGDRSGAAYVFLRAPSDLWVQAAKLLPSTGHAHAQFGYRVDVAGDLIVVGAPGQTVLGRNNAGSVFVFRKSGTQWLEEAQLVAADPGSGDQVGTFLAVDGQTVVAGALFDDESGMSNAGSAYVFSNSGGVWNQETRLLASDYSAGDVFGAAVDLSSDTAVVGAPGRDSSGVADSGGVYVYRRDEFGIWSEIATLVAQDGSSSDRFGTSVAIHGDAVVIGAPLDDDLGSDAGSSYLFVEDPSLGWLQEAKLVASDGAAGDSFGRVVALGDGCLLVGSPNDDDLSGGSGAAYLFERLGGLWLESEKLVPDGSSIGDGFGAYVEIQEEALAVGAPFDDVGGLNGGAVYFGFGSGCSSNQPPSANAGGPYSVVEGAELTVEGVGSDPDGDPLTFEWDLDGDGTFESPGASSGFSAVGLDGPSSVMVSFRVSDDSGLADTATISIEILNAAPTLGVVAGPGDPLPLGTGATLSAEFADPGVLDTHLAVWNWGDGESCSVGIAPECTLIETGGVGAVVGEHVYAAAGVYTVGVAVVDDDGSAAEAVFQYVVVYDPEGGSVTGGGRIQVSPGSYPTDPTLSGPAVFGFVSKYKQGASQATGSTEFQFRVAGLDFHSSSYEWLVVAGAKAQFRGVGTINGAGDYGFLITAIDEKLTPSLDVDQFRIKIWDRAAGDAVVFDNRLGEPADSDAATALSGGSIVIHKK